jgi:hypothetical protein
MRDLMINKLKEINHKAIETGNYNEIVTRLYYETNNQRHFVEDYSPFANKNFMSDELRNALTNHQTLTETQQNELNNFVIEKEYVMQ